MDPKDRQRRNLNYENTRQQFAFDFEELMKEYGLAFTDIARELNTSVSKTLNLIRNDNLTLKEIVTLITALQGTCRIVIVIPRP